MRFESLKRVECVHGRGSVQLVAALPRSSVWISFEEGVGKEKGRKGRGRERRGRGEGLVRQGERLLLAGEGNGRPWIYGDNTNWASGDLQQNQHLFCYYTLFCVKRTNF